jgi:hypothetical protein
VSCDLQWRFDLEVLKTISTDYKWVPKTGIFPVANGASVSASIYTINKAGSIEVQLAAQYFAVRPDKFDTYELLGSAITTDTRTPVIDTLAAGSELWAQLGYYYKGAGSAEGMIEIGMDLAIHQCIQIIGARRLVIPPTLTASNSDDDALIELLTDWVPAVGTPKIKVGSAAKSVRNGDLRDIIIYRTATDRTAPNTWQFALEAGYSTPGTGNSERNTGELSPTVTSSYWLQVAQAFRRVSGGAQVRADDETTVALIR